MPTKRQLQDEHMAQRLQDQLRVYKRVQAIRKNPRELDEIAFYPAHDKRRESPAYKKVHDKMVRDEDRPCLICGVRNSTLRDPKANTYGAKAIETHHHVIEWALANAISVEKFNKHMLPHLRKRHPDSHEYSQDFTQEQILDWVDHDEDNLWVLCDVHHRAKYLGIHEITFPIWGPMDLLRDDFEDYVRTEIGKLKGKKRPTLRKKPRS